MLSLLMFSRFYTFNGTFLSVHNKAIKKHSYVFEDMQNEVLNLILNDWTRYSTLPSLAVLCLVGSKTGPVFLD